MRKTTSGFTIVELLIVIVVIAILAAISVVAYTGVQARSRDSMRKSDLAEIKKALMLYYTDNGNYVETDSGCGYTGVGVGWFNGVGGSYPASIASCLTNAGYTQKNIIDPSGATSMSPTSGHAYMKYHCTISSVQHVYVYAKLETEPQSTTATDGTCQPSIDETYGANYYVRVK